MTAPCPTFGFRVVLEFRAALAAEARREFWAGWRSFLGDHGLRADPEPGTTDESCTVVAEGTQATESDRVATDAWLATRKELGHWRISGLDDVKQSARDRYGDAG